jgi:hypothetical protein
MPPSDAANDALADVGASDATIDASVDAPIDVGVDAGCMSAAQCGANASCIDGACCGATDVVCGAVCCTGGAACLFDQCVTPGAMCTSSEDCGAGEYCETDLAGAPVQQADAGIDGGACTEPLPLSGHCEPLPSTNTCSLTPNPGAPLDAVAIWSWGTNATFAPNYIDVWSTPAVARAFDTNCDGKVDTFDTPMVVFISGNDLAGAPAGTNCQSATSVPGFTMCQTSVLRALDGRSGAEIWSRDKLPSSVGFAGISPALADIDGDGRVDVLAVTGEGFIAMLDGESNLVRKSDQPIPGTAGVSSFGYGGGLAVADMDGDGFPEIAFGSSLFTTTGGKITLVFNGANGIGSNGINEALSTFVDLDGAADKHLELLVGSTAYRSDGTILWNNATLTDGFDGVADFNADGKPDVVVVGGGKIWIVNGADGSIQLGPATLPGTGSGGPPAIADLDGDGKPEIGVAMATFYSVVKPNYVTNAIDVLWQTANHDLSSSVTGSVAFDFEGDGKAEIAYADECFLWVFDGATGSVKFAAPHTSFTGTESPMVADIDGDGHAELVMPSNGADPSGSATGWHCMDATKTPITINGVTWTPSPLPNNSYRGIVAFGGSMHDWAGARTIWNEHTYHVTNICDDRDTACAAPNVYGSIPKVETPSWSLPWVNGFRSSTTLNSLAAPDAVVAARVNCGTPLTVVAAVRNIGQGVLPVVNVGIFKQVNDAQVGQGSTTMNLLDGQTEDVSIAVDTTMATAADTFFAKILTPPAECDTTNNASAPATSHCRP